MTGIHKQLETDRILFPYSWRSILIRDGILYSINHYRSGEMEIRYSIDSQKDADFFDIILADYQE